jgi:adenylate cyclase
MTLFAARRTAPVSAFPLPLLAAVIVAFVLSIAWQWLPPSLERWTANEWLRDRIVLSSANSEPEERIAVVDIDEASLAAMGPWPWPRSRIADLIEILISDYKARGVALDLVFPDTADAEGDMRLAMLAQHGPVVLPQAFDFNGDRPLRIGTLTGGQPALASAGGVRAIGFIANHDGLKSAAHIANIGFLPDRDGMIRRLPVQTWFEGRQYPTLSLALLNCCDKDLAQRAPVGPTGGFGGGNGMQRVPFTRSLDAYVAAPASEILARRMPLEWFANKLVLIGSSSLGLSDRVATPLSPVTSGLFVHAAALSAQLDERSGLAPKPWPGRFIAILFSLLISMAALYSFPRLSAAANMTLLGVASVAWLGLAWLTVPHDAVFNSTGPLLTNLFLLAVAVPLAWQTTQRQSRQLLGTLRQYVADAVVDELLRSNLSDPLAPRHGDVTTLIADMEGYTAHVASLPVEAAAQLTRDFLECLTQPVLAQRGTLDKFTGDGLVAFWGAPLPVDDHADQALDSALEIVRRVGSFNQERKARGLAPVRVRIGVESGHAMAGDFGTSSRSIYTAVGDSVNLASRLETAARDYPYDVIVGPGAATRARRHEFLPLGEIFLRGREQATPIFTLNALARMERAA